MPYIRRNFFLFLFVSCSDGGELGAVDSSAEWPFTLIFFSAGPSSLALVSCGRFCPLSSMRISDDLEKHSWRPDKQGGFLRNLRWPLEAMQIRYSIFFFCLVLKSASQRIQHPLYFVSLLRRQQFHILLGYFILVAPDVMQAALLQEGRVVEVREAQQFDDAGGVQQLLHDEGLTPRSESRNVVHQRCCLCSSHTNISLHQSGVTNETSTRISVTFFSVRGISSVYKKLTMSSKS